VRLSLAFYSNPIRSHSEYEIG